jgi:Family of unknown function (DUF6600)
MKTNLLGLTGSRTLICLICLAVAAAVLGGGNSCVAQTATVALPAGVQDVVKLVKAGMSDEVVLAQIKSQGASYTLSADQLIYLSGQGVSQTVIKALLQTNNSTPSAAPPAAPAAPSPVAPVAPAAVVPAPVAPPPGPAPSPMPAAPAPEAAVAPVVSAASFQAQLAPYGSWVQMPDYGLVWRPAVAAADPLWRPYCDQGHWIYTASGWYWQSDYPWGDIVFHYGRWARTGLGWVWAPGYDWAPAWVCWRQGEGYCGWAPLPPAAVFRAGVGLWFGGHAAVDIDFGLGPDMFTFVAYDRFWEHNLRGFILPRSRVAVVFRHSVIRNGYRFDHGRWIVEGPGRERIAALTHHEIRVEEGILHGGGPRGHIEVDRRDYRDDRRDRRDR